MRGSTVRVAQVVELFTEECIRCGVVFGITTAMKRERVQDHENFYCPNGHGQRYTSETDAEKNARLLCEEQARHQRTLARANAAEAEQARVVAEKAKVERKLKRVGRGVCPCCNRTFPNLARHMASQHPAEPKA